MADVCDEGRKWSSARCLGLRGKSLKQTGFSSDDYVPKCESFPFPVRKEGTEVFELGLE